MLFRITSKSLLSARDVVLECLFHAAFGYLPVHGRRKREYQEQYIVYNPNAFPVSAIAWNLENCD